MLGDLTPNNCYPEIIMWSVSWILWLSYLLSAKSIESPISLHLNEILSILSSVDQAFITVFVIQLAKWLMKEFKSDLSQVFCFGVAKIFNFFWRAIKLWNFLVKVAIFWGDMYFVLNMDFAFIISHLKYLITKLRWRKCFPCS